MNEPADIFPVETILWSAIVDRQYVRLVAEGAESHWLCDCGQVAQPRPNAAPSCEHIRFGFDAWFGRDTPGEVTITYVTDGPGGDSRSSLYGVTKPHHHSKRALKATPMSERKGPKDIDYMRKATTIRKMAAAAKADQARAELLRLAAAYEHLAWGTRRLHAHSRKPSDA
jgi:hypothetical protein